MAAVVKPSTEAAIPNLVRDDAELAKANSLFGSTWGVMLAVGAAIGGVFASVFGRDAAFIARTGKTHGIRFSTNPPSSARASAARIDNARVMAA